MGKISDIWVRLGLKKNEFDKGMDDAGKKAEGFGGTLGKMKAGALAVWAAIGAAVVKFTKDFINATNAIGDKWAQTMAGVKAGYQNFLGSLANMKIDTSNGVKGFFSSIGDFFKDASGNAIEAGKAAAEMTAAFDAEFELANSIRLKKAEIQEELNELYIAMRDTTLSPADRKAAADKYRALLQPLADAEVKVYKNMLESASKAWQAGTGLSREYSVDEMSDFFSNYGIDPEGMKSKYGELVNVYETMKNDDANMVIVDTLAKLRQAMAQMSDIDKLLSRSELTIDKALADTSGAMQEQLVADLEAGLDAINEAVDDIEDVEIVMPEIDTSPLDKYEARLREVVDKYAEEQARIDKLSGMVSDSLVAAMSNGLQAITDLMIGLEGANASQVFASILSPFADTMVKLGEILIAESGAIKAFKESLKNLDWKVSLAAGVGLIAIGASLKAGIQRLGGSAGGGGATSSYSYGGGSYGSPEIQNYESTLTVEVTGRISGSDIVLAGQKTQNSWNR